MTAPLPVPLAGPPPAEVPLPRAPLVRVLAQVRFPTQLAIHRPDAVAQFQERVRQAYPILHEDRAFHVVGLASAGGEQTQETRSVPNWRFFEKANQWRVSLAPDFVSLETTAYTNRAEFLSRLRLVLSAVEHVFDPQEALRVGLRYIDRVSGAELGQVNTFLRPQILGLAQTELAPFAQHFMTDTQLHAEEGKIQARWGFLPPRATIDPGVLEPIDAASWILDLDMFSADVQPFNADELVGLTENFAKRSYAVFRWVVTPDFLRAYGGEP